MKFFKLTHPNYGSDAAFHAKNPVTSEASWWVPAITCDVCGLWSSSERLRVPVPPAPHDFSGANGLESVQWFQSRGAWARALGVDEERVVPGAKIGPPIGLCRSRILEDAVHPIPGEIWVGATLRRALEAADLAGLTFARVEFSPEHADIELWELIVQGRAWRAGSTLESLKACDLCGRLKFPSPGSLAVDEDRWDGTDALHLDYNPNIIVVTERVAEVLDRHTFSNIIAAPI